MPPRPLLRSQPATSGAVRSGGSVALLALDLDHFKSINDCFGHLAGDGVLGEVSAAMRAAAVADGVVAGLGGEEFAILLPRADAEEAAVVAERVLSRLRAMRFESLPRDVRLTISAGIAAESMQEPYASDALRARADEALYAAKRNGRDRALLWAPGVRSHATPVRSFSIPGNLRIPVRDDALPERAD